MTRYYVLDKYAKNGFEEVTEEEYTALFGTDETRQYTTMVYRNKITISEVPIELQEQVQTTVNNRIARFGEYQSKATEEDLYNALAELGVTEDD